MGTQLVASPPFVGKVQTTVSAVKEKGVSPFKLQPQTEEKNLHTHCVKGKTRGICLQLLFHVDCPNNSVCTPQKGGSDVQITAPN